MTKARLRNNVLLIILMFASLLVAGAACKFYFKFDDGYAFIKDFAPLLIAIAAAHLAFCFQRRQAFLASLRELWKDLIGTKADLLDYSYNVNPDQAAFGVAHRSLSMVIDSVRGVYRNVGETDKKVGLYPLEPLHDMRRVLEGLGFRDATLDKQSAARRQILQAWNALRCVFLKEFSTPESSHPITARFTSDPRRIPRKDR